MESAYNHWLPALVKGKCSSTKPTRLGIGVVCHPDTEQNRPTKSPLQGLNRCKNIDSPPTTESPPSIDIHGVKRDLDKKHWCIPHHLIQSSVGAGRAILGTLYFFTPGPILHRKRELYRCGTLLLSSSTKNYKNRRLYSKNLRRGGNHLLR